MLIRVVARLKKSLKLQYFIFKFGSFVLGLSFVSDPVGLFLFSFDLDGIENFGSHSLFTKKRKLCTNQWRTKTFLTDLLYSGSNFEIVIAFAI